MPFLKLESCSHCNCMENNNKDINSKSLLFVLQKKSHTGLEQHEVRVNDKIIIFGCNNPLRLSICCLTTKEAPCSCSGVGV